MPNEREVQLWNRCAGYLHELSFGGTDTPVVERLISRPATISQNRVRHPAVRRSSLVDNLRRNPDQRFGWAYRGLGGAM
jgi:hypothetical protein